jgi:hypothetical protein
VKKRHCWTTCWKQELVTARVAATRRRKRLSGATEPSADSVQESKKGKTAAVAAARVSIVPKVESRGFLFDIDDDSDPNFYD